MGFIWQAVVVFSVCLALAGCGSSLDKQVTQLTEQVKKLEESIGKLE